MMFLNKSLSIICHRHSLQQYMNVFWMKVKLVLYVISYFKNKILMKFKKNEDYSYNINYLLYT